MADRLDDDKMEDEEYEFGGEATPDAESSFTPEYEDFGAQAEAEANLDLEGDETPQMPMDGPSPLVKKLMTYGAMAVATVALGFYLMHSEQSKRTEADGALPEATPAVAKLQADQPLNLTPAPEPTPEPEVQQAVPVVEPVSVTPTPAPAVSAEQAEQMTGLAKQVESNKLSLDNVQVRLESLQDSIKQGMDSLQSDIKNLKVTPKPDVKPYKAVKRRPQPVVHREPREHLSVKAIVPGRAWIGSSLGFNRTVTVGDHLPGYGKVHKIDAANGRVVTSSGTVIVYGPGDF